MEVVTVEVIMLHCQPDGTKTYLAQQYPFSDVQSLVVSPLWISRWASYLISLDGRALLVSGAMWFHRLMISFWIRLIR
jgi:hypothetical protein